MVQEAAERYQRWQMIARYAMVVAALSVALLGLFIASARISPEFRARHATERVLSGLMMACSLIAILTTLGIVLSLLFEALRFFERVSPLEFFFGLNWEPQIPIREGQVTAGGSFGAIPVFTGTLLISAIALAVAIPIGLLSAIYLTEYAHPKFRAVVKPLLELLGRHSDRGLRLLRRARGRPVHARFRRNDRHSHRAEQRARRRCGDGHHDYPVCVLSVR